MWNPISRTFVIPSQTFSEIGGENCVPNSVRIFVWPDMCVMHIETPFSGKSNLISCQHN
jgi:hypothetical protein